MSVRQGLAAWPRGSTQGRNFKDFADRSEFRASDCEKLTFGSYARFGNLHCSSFCGPPSCSGLRDMGLGEVYLGSIADKEARAYVGLARATATQQFFTFAVLDLQTKS